MKHRLKVFCVELVLIALVGVTGLRADTTPLMDSDYARLLGFSATQDPPATPIVFGPAKKDFDPKLNGENVAYLNKDKALIQNIQSRLNTENINWEVTDCFKQLLVVPENRLECAQLFENYCRTAVDYLLERIHMPSPYERIVTLEGPLPALPDSRQAKGLTVYLVHDLIDEYIEEYQFFGSADRQNKITIKLSNHKCDCKVGSIISQLKIDADHHIEFSNQAYTLWQNSARNALDVLIVPIEETLHSLVRPHTQAAIQDALMQSKSTRRDHVKQVVDDWIAVEEAIVGGVVWRVMPDVLNRYLPQVSPDLLSTVLTERQTHPQYRFLKRAIRLVEDMGVDQALAAYRQDPQDFRHRLDPPDNTKISSLLLP